MPCMKKCVSMSKVETIMVVGVGGVGKHITGKELQELCNSAPIIAEARKLTNEIRKIAITTIEPLDYPDGRSKIRERRAKRK